MKRFVGMATAWIFLLSLQGVAWAQKEVQPPAVPPMLEGQRPLQSPETKEPVAPKKAEEEKAKPKTKAQAPVGKKTPKKKADVKKPAKKKNDTAGKKKAQKPSKKKRPAAESKQAGPDEG
jgi:hypothetical protein